MLTERGYRHNHRTLEDARYTIEKTARATEQSLNEYKAQQQKRRDRHQAAGVAVAAAGAAAAPEGLVSSSDDDDANKFDENFTLQTAISKWAHNL